jgi:FKBP-type peptidyl-prolyl cis-trans isomerase SlyD
VKIGNNTVVTMDYRLTNSEGEELDSSANGEQIVYLHGADELLDSLETALEGKSSGDALTVTLSAAEAYGEELEELIQIMHIDEFNGLEVLPGMELESDDPDGDYELLLVQAVDGDQVTVNMNHPLAGMALGFELKIRDVRAATKAELATGQAH